jgi:hypothetical protein
MNYEYQLLQKEVEFLGGVLDKVTKERNMYRTQAMMRMNRIKELEDNERKILKESFDPSS